MPIVLPCRRIRLLSDVRRVRIPGWLALSVALLVAFLAGRQSIFGSWVPSDDGVLAQSAERVMRGELPHRDFIALWSGGLDYLNAIAFRLLGVRLATLRLVLIGSWLIALSAAFAAARHLLTPAAAGALTIVMAKLTLPYSPHPLPSWYTLFFALGGTLAVLAYERSRHRRWLVAAGAAAALSCAVKITGLYFTAAVVLYALWVTQDEVSASNQGVQGRSARPYFLFVALGLLLFLAMVGGLVRSHFSAPGVVHFVVPHVLLVALLLVREWRLPAGNDRSRFMTLLSLLVPLAAGFGAVVAVWVIPYLHAGAVGDLLRGIFVTPQSRLRMVTFELPGLRISGLSVTPLAVFLAGAPFVRRPLRRIDLAALAIVTTALASLVFDGSMLTNMVWNALRLLTPLCVGLAVWWLAAPPAGLEIPPEKRATLFFLCATATTCSLVQIPFALYTYFLYILPLVLLAAVALVTFQRAIPRPVAYALFLFLLFFGIRGPLFSARREPKPAEALVPLGLARGGIIVSRTDSTRYSRLVHVVQQHAAGGGLYVWHDMPELYFLSALPNPTRTMFELFDTPADRDPDLLRKRLEARNVRVVVLADPRTAVTALDPAFHRWIMTSYPYVESVYSWEVRWR